MTSDTANIRHVVSIAGIVRMMSLEPRSEPGQNSPVAWRWAPVTYRAAGARVEILVERSPQAFRDMVKTVQPNPDDPDDPAWPAWKRKKKRIDRAVTESDGVFFFTDLPSGKQDERYWLRASLPDRGTRCGNAVFDLKVSKHHAGDRLKVAFAEVELPVTRLRGTVTDLATSKPIPSASVRLRGTAEVIHTDSTGQYALNFLVAGSPTVEFSAPGFATRTQEVTLRAGDEKTIDMQLWSGP